MKERSSFQDQRHSFSHSELHVAEVLLKWRGVGKASDIDIRKGQRVPQSLDLSRPYVIFNCLLTIERSCQTHSLNMHLKVTGSVRMFL